MHMFMQHLCSYVNWEYSQNVFPEFFSNEGIMLRTRVHNTLSLKRPGN